MTRLRHVVLGISLIATVALVGVLTTSSPADARGPGSAPITIVGPLPLPVRGLIANDDSNPIPVRDVDQAAREPFQADLFETYEGFSGATVVVKVPVGKRLVIEHVSAAVTLQTGGLTTAGLSAGDFFVTVPCATMSLDFNGRPHYACAVQTKLFVESDKTVHFSVHTSADSGGFFRGFVSGYYVPAP
jgi:hypothetical protein